MSGGCMGMHGGTAMAQRAPWHGRQSLMRAVLFLPEDIRLVDGDHDIDCKIEGVAMALKSCFVKKA